jgi:penicillin V acylase-like amidase (Ntn superfamily)
MDFKLRRLTDMPRKRVYVLRSLSLIAAFLLVFFFLIDASSEACSSFCLKDGKTLLFGNNFDFYTGTARVIINKRGVSKTAFLPPGDIPAKWVSKYGSITFDQAGWEFPYQGMNEEGLVVAQMWLDKTKYSKPDQRGAVFCLQWIQYQLDTAKTIEEVMASDKYIRISEMSSPLHFLVCDHTGKAAVIEYLDGKFVTTTGADMPYPVLTNDAYAESAAFTTEYKKSGRWSDIPKTVGSSERFGRAAAMLINYKKQKPAVAYAFDILTEVSQPQTRYSIVFDIKNGKIYYRTKNNQEIRVLTLKDFDYSCKSPVMGIDIESNIIKGKDDFQPFTIEMNRALIEKIITECDFFKQALDPMKDFLIKYPESLICTDTEK